MELIKNESEFNLFDWWKKVLFNNYANFEGRARRSEYWYFTLVNILIVIPVIICFAITGNNFGEDSPIFLLMTLFFGACSLALVIPSIAVAVRRLHDTGKSGWWYLLGVIPIVSFIGGIVLLIFYCMDSDAGQNAYGPNPKEELR